MRRYPKPNCSEDSDESLAKRMRGESFQDPDQADCAVAGIIKKACAYKAKDRYSSPMKMKKDLEQYLTNLPDVEKNKLVTMLNKKE